MSLAHILKYYREEVVEISQKDAAYQLNIRPATLSNYERGVRQFPIDILRKMKDIYHIDDDTFMAIVLYETTDKEIIKEAKYEVTQKVMKAEDRQLMDFLRENHSLLDEIRALSQMPPNKQKHHTDFFVSMLKVARTYLK
ncbi:helix-turn-helix domain-containing protein [Jeotgalibacillus haloalkalitolerans]|uniref:Helix-turn-helix transcriptional regulator n=1 Tax=Jeotgalibacillus haloalkalitolerans TaxID=3104292 RepID=A0ABU5KJ61_9BACL|nr:helix-turn-helix transcriptional regulator [Jeotgalibacillus sp. HH7-29]MDZ5711276.1 helix-turn-helix transcriptional regulator [Jeotgalibacillus sp. HH7-29]